MDNSTLIKNGTVATTEGCFAADVLISNGKIAQVGENLSSENAEVYDARGMLVLPGIIDPHVQLEIKYGKFPMTDDFDTGTVAAAAGGVTTIIDFADQPKGVKAKDDLKNRRALADGRVNVDYTLHMSITDVSVGAVGEMRDIVDSGIGSFKCYMTYKRRDRMVDEGALDDIMAEAGRLDAVVGVHAENDNFLEYLHEKMVAEGKTAMRYFQASHPVEAEVMAVETAIILAKRNDCPLYVHHVSNAQTMEAIKRGRERGITIFAETCPAYLTLTEAEYQKEGGELFLLNPALRGEEDVKALWEAVIKGDIDTIGTDHCSYLKEQKQANNGNWEGTPAGLPGIELLLPVMYTIGVAQKRISIERMLEMMSRNPARIFGLAPQKGSIAPGSDGDVVIFDANKKWKVDPAKLLMNVDFTPFDSWEMAGAVKATFLRGMKIYEDGAFCGPRHQGLYVFGKRNSLLMSR